MALRERILLRDGLNRDIADDLAVDLDWVFVTLLRKTEETPFRIAIYRVPRTHEQVEYVEDFVIDRGYLIITGPDPRAVAATIRPRVDVIGPDEVLGRLAAARSTEERIGGLYDASIVAPQSSEPHLLQAFYSAFEDSEPEVRRAAILAVGYVEWAELRALLPGMAERDPDPEVREHAAAMLESLQSPKPDAS
jgi:HEAT repeats